MPVALTVGAAAADTTDAADAAPVSGTLSVQRFARTETGVAAVGTLTVSVPDTASSVARTIVTQVALPLARPGSEAAPAGTIAGQTTAAVTPPAAECGTLNLALGAVDVEALGLPLHIEQVAVAVTAVDGSTQLGTLLCQIANLLDSETAPAELVTALNRLLDMLG